MDRRVVRTLTALAAATALAVTVTVTFAGPGHPAGGARPAVVLRGVPIADPVVALTIDDGPTRAYTRDMLEILKRHRAVATFFVIGRSATAHPDLVRAELEQGCEIGSHTWSHLRMGERGQARDLDEVVRGAAALERITGRPTLYFRPPRGKLPVAALSAARGDGMRAVLWDQCLDHRADKTPEDAAERVLARIGPGDVILLHDGGGDRRKTVAALELLLTGLEARGYRFVTLSQLYRMGGVRL